MFLLKQVYADGKDSLVSATGGLCIKPSRGLRTGLGDYPVVVEYNSIKQNMLQNFKGNLVGGLDGRFLCCQ